MLHLTANPPLSLYIHLPWCRQKCPYCDFNSYAVNADRPPEEHYIEALIADLDAALPGIRGRPVVSMFIGGGTPSLFSADAVGHLMAAVRARLRLSPDVEITLEVNPGDTDCFTGYRDAGVNRLSLGVQSFNDAHLKALGRIHNGEEARRAIQHAKNAGFDAINLDLMFGLPRQSISAALTDLEIALQYRPSHLSWYQLTIEPNTAFYSHPPRLPGDDQLWAMQCAGLDYLSSQGFQQYEVSAYAKSGEKQHDSRCRHNLNYWHFGDYLGIGAGAHSKLTQIGSATIQRHTRHRIPNTYIERSLNANAITDTKIVPAEELPLEFMMNALRLNAGFHASLFMERTGIPLAAIQKPLATAKSRALIDWTTNTIKATGLGKRYLNDTLQLFMP